MYIISDGPAWSLGGCKRPQHCTFSYIFHDSLRDELLCDKSQFDVHMKCLSCCGDNRIFSTNPISMHVGFEW